MIECRDLTKKYGELFAVDRLSLKLDPAKKADIPADQQAKFVADYQAKMKAFIADVNKVEAALKAGNNDEAAKLLQSLKQDQDEGHKEFQKKKKKG